jgi:hypothetical protein
MRQQEKEIDAWDRRGTLLLWLYGLQNIKRLALSSEACSSAFLSGHPYARTAKGR